ncbi:MAG: glycosyltransferase family 87 protein [Pontiella sp.]
MSKLVDKFYGLVGRMRFVFLCAAASLIWCAILVPCLCLYQGGVRPIYNSEDGNQDIANYYMAGKVLIHGRFDALYPIPIEGKNSHNIGWPEMSEVKPGYRDLMGKYGVEDNHRFILPPPSALLFVPFSLLPYPLAKWVWVIALGSAFWGAGFLAFRIGLRTGATVQVALLWWLVWSFSPLYLKGLRTGNATPLAALFLGLAAVGVYKNKAARTVVGCIAVTLLKGTGVLLIPLILLLKRWKIAIVGVVLTTCILGLMLVIAGGDLFREYFSVVYTTTRQPDSFIGNQSVFGFLVRVLGTLTSFQITLIKSLSAVMLGACCWKMWQTRKLLRNDFPYFINWVVVLLSIYLLSSFYCWEHYMFFYLPFWIVLWGSSGRCVKGLLLVSSLLILVPFSVVRGGAWCSVEPFGSHMMLGQVLILIGALFNVLKTIRSA